jgi:hypothetical protein
MGVCGPRMAHGVLKWAGPTEHGEVEFTNPQLRQRFSRVERVTGIEPALSAWESHMDPRSVLTWRI